MSNLPRVVFMANDAVLEQLIAFLESFRTTNPDLPLTMIPFADDVSKCERLRHVYNFDTFQADYSRWDKLAHEFFPEAARYKKFIHRLRKLAVFDVQSPATIYLDIDTVVMRDLNFLRQPIVDGVADFICTATSNDPWVYNSNYSKYPQFAKSLRFSDGFFAFNPLKLNSETAFKVITENKDIYLDVRAKDVFCQPLTNFVVDMLGLKVKEVFRLFQNISSQVWYAAAGLSHDGAQVTNRDGKEVLFVHWAGPVDMTKDVPLKGLYRHFIDRAEKRLAAAGESDLVSVAAGR